MCKSARNFDQGRIDSKLTSMIKMVAGSCAPEVCDEAAQLPGVTGYMLAYGGECFVRDAKICELCEGTGEIRKNTIASYLMGKVN